MKSCHFSGVPSALQTQMRRTSKHRSALQFLDLVRNCSVGHVKLALSGLYQCSQKLFASPDSNDGKLALSYHSGDKTEILRRLLQCSRNVPKKRLHHCCVALMGFTFLAVKHCTQFPGVESHEPSGCSPRNWYCEGSREKDMQVLAGCSR